VQIVRSSLSRFARALSERARSLELPEVIGELRDSYGYTWTLQGTFATRSRDKRHNAQLERMLLHDVEPWCALATMVRIEQQLQQHEADPVDTRAAGGIGLPQLTPLLEAAWKRLLETHPHDTLCGCSVDAVALSMQERQRNVRAMGIGLRDAALDLLCDRNAVEARSAPIAEAQSRVIVRNRTAVARAGVTEIQIFETIGDVSVGPGSADRPLPQVDDASAPAFGEFVQTLSTRYAHERRESPQHYPDDDLVRITKALAWVPQIPAFGIRSFDLNDFTGPLNPTSLSVDGDAVTVTNGIISAGFDGTDIWFEYVGRRISSLISIESTVDAGDSYTASLRGAPRLLSIMRCQASSSGPLRAGFDIVWKLEATAADVDSDLESMGALRTRKNRNESVSIRTRISIDANSSDLRVRVVGENRMKNHRLRIIFHHDLAALAQCTVRADAAFGHVIRQPIDDGKSPLEKAPSTMPLHRWLNCSDDSKSFTVVSDGLTEAEAVEGGVAVTILRAIGELSRANLPERPGHAGWPAAIPRAQSLGRHSASFAIRMDNRWSGDSPATISEATDRHLLPLVGETWRDIGHDVSVVGPELTGNNLRCTSFAPAQRDGEVMLRIVNESEVPQQGSWQLHRDGYQFAWARLDETPISEWTAVVDRRIEFTAAARAAMTLLLRLV
jgi:hypothetical protein